MAKTMKVEAADPKTQGPFVTINESDFDEKKHKRYDPEAGAKAAAAAEAKAKADAEAKAKADAAAAEKAAAKPNQNKA